MTCRQVVFGKRLRDFNGTQRPDNSVVVSTFGHAVDVRAEQQGSEVVRASCAPADDVSSSVDSNVELRTAHKTDNILTSLLVSIAISDATDTTLRVLAKLGQGVEVFHQSWAVDSELRLERESAKRH